MRTFVRIIRTLFIILSVFLTRTEGAKILAAFPVPSISHQVVFRPLTQELAKRGHEVVVITTDPAFPKEETPANLTEIDVHDITYSYWRNNYKISDKGWKNDPITHIKDAHKHFSRIFEIQLQNEDVKRIIKEESFDLVIVEAASRPAYIFGHIFKAPIILISSAGSLTGVNELMGIPTHPILYPTILRLRIHNLTMYEKLREMYYNFNALKNYYEVDSFVDDILKRNFGQNTPSINELRNNVDMLFLNIHPILEGNYPVPPSVIHIWGIHKTPERELPKDLISYLDNSKTGVIYMSFGTNVNPSMLPRERVEMITKVLSQLPYDVLWKWNGDDDKELASNIRIGKWFPQSDLLKHPNVKLFITQGGLQSTDEAITAGVPLIGIPMIADQWFNTEKYVKNKIGLQLDLETVTEDEFKNSIIKVIEDKSYRNNVVRLRSLLVDQPQSGLDRAVWWTEHVLRHGGARHLRSPAANISWAEYFEIDLIVLVLVVLVFIVTLLSLIIRQLLKFISNGSKSTIKNKIN